MFCDHARKIVQAYARQQGWSHREVRGLLEEFLNERPDLLLDLTSFLSEAAEASRESWMMQDNSMHHELDNETFNETISL